MNPAPTIYCGRFTTMGHGDSSKCGEMHYAEIYQCHSCQAKTILALRGSLETAERMAEIRLQERRRSDARYEHTVGILTRIHNYLSQPYMVTVDGKVLEFVNRDPEVDRQTLRLLSESIRAIPDELAKARAAHGWSDSDRYRMARKVGLVSLGSEAGLDAELAKASTDRISGDSFAEGYGPSGAEERG